MNRTIEHYIGQLKENGNFRQIPVDNAPENLVDLSSNDYLGLAVDAALREKFLSEGVAKALSLSASASRLLAACQQPYSKLEKLLEHYYGRPALLFNSGYHANTGIIGAIGKLPGVHIVADKLVHASIIDGLKLSGAPFSRFRHNNFTHLRQLVERARGEGARNILVVVESVYSMDGDRTDVEALIDLKKDFPEIILYVDEAHAVGVEGPAGLGLVAASPRASKVDIVVGTFGKALASAGAYAIVSPLMRDFLVNTARSLIFSTALPPLQIAWTEHVFKHMTELDSARQKLKQLGRALSAVLSPGNPTEAHIQPLIAGAPERAVQWSQQLRVEGFAVLPIRTPTVPPGTDRLRFSLSAAIDPAKLATLNIDSLNEK